MDELTSSAKSFPNDTLGLGGVNLEGKEFVFEPNSQDDFGAQYSAAYGPDPNGRPIQVNVVRNRSGIYLKGGLLAHYDEGGTFTFSANTVGPFNLETGVARVNRISSPGPLAVGY